MNSSQLSLSTASSQLSIQHAHGKVEVNCEICAEAVAKSFCRQCAMFICKMCVDSHLRMKTLFAGHQVISIQDLKENKVKVDIPMKRFESLKCSIHYKSLKVYCYDCNCLICRDCTVLDHKDHHFQFSAVAAPEIKDELVKELKALRQVGDGLSRAVEEVKSTRHEVEAQGESVAQTINTAFDELLRIVGKRRQELLEEAGRRVQEKVSKLSVQEKNLSLASAEVQSVIDYTERCVKHCTDNEVVSMHKDIRSRVMHEMDQHSKGRTLMEPMEEVDLGIEVRCTEEVLQLCQTKASVIQLPIDPTQCRMTGEGVKIAEIHQTAIVTLTANKLTNKARKTQC